MLPYMLSIPKLFTGRTCLVIDCAQPRTSQVARKKEQVEPDDWSGTEWSLAFLKLSATVDGCAKRFERFCQRYRHHSKAAPKCLWGSRMLKRLVSSARTRSKKKRVSPGQYRLPWAFDVSLIQVPVDWLQVAVKLPRPILIRDCDIQPIISVVDIKTTAC